MIIKITRNILKVIAYILGTIVVLLIAFHFWFINHAEQLLEDLVESQSNGKVKLHVKRVRYNWFTHDLHLRHAVFYSTDTTAVNSYQFSVERIELSVKKILPVVLEKKMVFDSLIVINPDIVVTQLRTAKTDTSQEAGLSLTQEMGRVYNSIQDALQVLKVKQFLIDNGKFTLVNKTRPDELPVTITNIRFHLDNLRIDSSDKSGKHRILFSDNVALQTHDQDIYFPDGRHRLSFGNFRINILKRIVEFDSCTIVASKADSARSSFKIFFDKLRLTNIDFDTLYQKEVIKADSVYCTNPQFRLDVELGKKTGKKKPTLKLNDLIQQLTGDLQLAFVIVNNGSFDINTLREGKPSSFTSDHNNFEMQGLRIEKAAARPLTVKSFAMAIRNYETFLRDSTYAMQFDSILLVNNSIYLSNFSVKQLKNNKVVNYFSMPRFELKGLSWDDLVFDQKLVAERATLYHPVINYSVVDNNRKNKQDVFQTLGGIGDIIQLNILDISNGKITVYFKDNSQLQLENASMSVAGESLIESKRIGNLQKSVRWLRFKNGQLKLANMNVVMENVDFTGKDGELIAGTMLLDSKEKNLSIRAKGVGIKNMEIDNSSHIIEIDGIHWDQAEVEIKNQTAKKKVRPFVIRNIRGSDTKINASPGSVRLNVFFETISADELAPTKDNKLRITNLITTGKNLSLTNNNLQLGIDHFQVADHQSSTIEGLTFSNYTATDSISAAIPSIGFSPDVNALINGSLVTEHLHLVQPVIHLKSHPSLTGGAPVAKKSRKVEIGKISIQQPEFIYQQSGNKELKSLEWRGKSMPNNSFEATNFRLDSGSAITASELKFLLNNFSFNAGGKKFDAGKGEINSTITNFYLERTDVNEHDWRGNIKNLAATKFMLDSIGKRPGRLDIQTLKLSDLDISNTTLLNLPKLMKENNLFRLKEVTGNYTDSLNHYNWANAGYDKSTKTFTLDSFILTPVMSRDSFMATNKYQKDYITLSTGPLSAGPFDVETYLTDTIINIGTIRLQNTFFSSYRDKRLPFKSGVIKPLSVAFLKKIPVHFSADTISLDNTHVEYTELNEKTNQAGTILVTKMDAKLYPVTNYHLRSDDSLHMSVSGSLQDSIRVKLYLHESYAGSSANFLLKGEVSRFDMRVMNRVLMPLASTKLESGILDTLSMNVAGSDFVAMGEMKMIYHNLKIKLLSNKAGKKKSYKGFASFLANTFVIKNNNSTRTGTIFFERNRDRSSFNYLAKIVLSGISSSIGLKNNKKLQRRYKKELNKRNPPQG